MKKTLPIPVIRCDQCGNELEIKFRTNKLKLKECNISCVSCEYQLDLIKEIKGQAASSKKRIKKVSKEASKSIRKARKEMPTNMDEVKEALKDPKHPFTAAVLTGLILVAMELSGFGIFAALTWILGNLILNPVGWVVIPLVVAIVFAYRKLLKAERLAKLRKELDDLEGQRDRGEISKEECDARRYEAVKKILDYKVDDS